MAGALAEVTGQSFEEFVKGTSVAVVDFSATWCGPCQMLKPTIEALAAENAGKVNIGKVDVDNDNELAARFGVNSVPTLIFFKDGEQKDSILGVAPKEAIAAKIKSLQ